MSNTFKFLTIGFFAIIFMAFANQSQAQTSTVTVTNNTGCPMRVIMEGYVGPIPCIGTQAGANAVVVPAGGTTMISWLGSGGMPISAFFTQATAQEVSAVPPAGAAIDLCSGLNITGTSSCGTYNLSYIKIGITWQIVIQ